MRLTVSFRQKLNLCLEALEKGQDILTSGNFTLSWSQEHEDVGFRMTVYRGRDSGHDVIMQIGSAEAWGSLRDHARKMTADQYVALCGKLGYNKD